MQNTQVAPSPEAEHPLIGVEVGKYRLVRLCGRGGMGSVFEAVHSTIGQRVAVKVLNAAFSEEPEILQRFFIEARASSLVQHPGLVQIFDYGTIGAGDTGAAAPGAAGRAYIMMELLEGESLRQRLRREGPLPLPEALPLLRLIASAVAAAHEKSIIHRDLKPENIFLVADPAGPSGVRPKVLDFGIAKLADPSESDSGLRTNTGALLGTPAYMSPEQCRAEPVTPKSDVYSLGVVLFHVLTGETPFGDTASGEIYARHLYEAPPRLSDRLRGAPPALDDLCASMLAKDPADRPTMRQIEDVLGAAALLPGGATQVLGLPRGFRLRRVLRAFVRRREVQIGAPLLFFLLSAVLTCYIVLAPRVPQPARPTLARATAPTVAAPRAPGSVAPPAVAPSATSAPPAPAASPASAASAAPERRPADPPRKRQKTQAAKAPEDDLEFEVAR